MSLRKLGGAVAGMAAVATLSTGTAAMAAPADGHVLPADGRFYVQPDSKAALQALTDLQHGQLQDALTMAKLASYPEATWYTSGTPAEVQAKVAQEERAAALQRAIRGEPPVLLLDEVAAHLDASRRAALFEALLRLESQAWLTGTDEALFAPLRCQAQFLSVHDGTLAATFS